jgi:formyl-CoA transferase
MSVDADTKRPLEGVRVLDLSRLVAGNILTHVLADFGAEVIKIEPSGGDPLRAWQIKGISTYWKTYCRNKKSVSLNLRTQQAKALLFRLIERADVFVENFRPGTLERMGLAPDTLLACNPGLVVVRISGWGQTGPYRHRPGFGTLIEGYSGFAAMNGFADREPVLPPIQLADSVAGLQGATATLLALRHREVNGGTGQIVDLSLFEPLFSILGPHAANYRLTGKPKARTGSRSTTAAPRNVYRTRDGKWLCLSASMQGMAERLFKAIGREDLIGNPSYASNADRIEHGEELDAIIGAFVGRRTLAENLSFFEQSDVTIGAVNDISDIMEDDYIRERGVLCEISDHEMGSIPVHAAVPRLSETPGQIMRPAPWLGEHNAEVIGQLGYPDVDIARFYEAGVLCDATVRTTEGDM